jgi:hypothetical protein
MPQASPPDAPIDCAAVAAFIAAAGRQTWQRRMAEVVGWTRGGQRSGRALLQRHAVELTIDRLARGLDRPPSVAERIVGGLAADAARLYKGLPPDPRLRMRAAIVAGLTGAETLVPLFHLLRTAALQRARGFDVRFAGFEDEAPFDLLLKRDGVEAEVACDTVSAEEGRDVHRGAWFQLVDRIDADLQTWLANHPGRYLLKLTLPQGLRREADTLASLHARIRDMLENQRRADHDPACMLRLDPLMLAGAQAEETGLLQGLRREFGSQAHLAVTSAGQGVFVLAARAAREDEVAAAIRRRLFAIAPARLTGTRPGILAMFVEDTDRTEWSELRERLELEGEARQFLAQPAARTVVAVTCASRLELMGACDCAPDGEFRFRNPSHPAAKTVALAPAVLSSV